MSKAEERALEAYPKDLWFANPGDCGIVKNPRQKDYNAEKRAAFILGYKQAEKDITTIIESRLSEIIGDAQPKPALRAELEDLITKIKD